MKTTCEKYLLVGMVLILSLQSPALAALERSPCKGHVCCCHMMAMESFTSRVIDTLTDKECCSPLADVPCNVQQKASPIRQAAITHSFKAHLPDSKAHVIICEIHPAAQQVIRFRSVAIQKGKTRIIPLYIQHLSFIC